MLFTVGCFPFLWCHPRVPGVPLIPSICSPGYQNQCCVSNIGGWPLPHSSLFSSFGVSSSKVYCCLSVLVCLKELTSGFSPFKVSSSHLFRLNFWLSFPLSFFPSELIHSCHVESFPATSLHGSSFWVPRGTSPLFMNCWFPSLLIPFCIIGWLIGTYLFSFLVFLGTPFELS